MVAAFGPALSLIPIDTLRVVVGTLLLVFGLQWLRKAILRAVGYKALRDEEALFRADRKARAAGKTIRAGLDWYAFTLAFKGVFLEGLEVALSCSPSARPGEHPAGRAGCRHRAVLVVDRRAVVHQAAQPGAGKHDEVRGGPDAGDFRHLLERRGRGRGWPGADVAILGILVFLTLVSSAWSPCSAVRPDTGWPGALRREPNMTTLGISCASGTTYRRRRLGGGGRRGAGARRHRLRSRAGGLNAWWVLPAAVVVLLTASSGGRPGVRNSETNEWVGQ